MVLGPEACTVTNPPLTVCCAAPPESVVLQIDHMTPNLLLIDKVAGETPRKLVPDLEGFLDLDGDEDLVETFYLMSEMPKYRDRRVYEFLKKRMSNGGG